MIAVDGALCAQADPDQWFPDKGQASPLAVAICRDCPVATACLEYALSHPEGQWGIWAGTTARQRRAIRQARAA